MEVYFNYIKDKYFVWWTLFLTVFFSLLIFGTSLFFVDAQDDEYNQYIESQNLHSFHPTDLENTSSLHIQDDGFLDNTPPIQDDIPQIPIITEDEIYLEGIRDESNDFESIQIEKEIKRDEEVIILPPSQNINNETEISHPQEILDDTNNTYIQEMEIPEVKKEEYIPLYEEFEDVGKEDENIDIKDDFQQDIYEETLSQMKQEITLKEQELFAASPFVEISYYPPSERNFFDTHMGIAMIKYVYSNPLFSKKEIQFLLDVFKDSGEVRGKFYKNTISLYDLGQLPGDEVLGVFLHEFGHYFDIDYFHFTSYYDVSNDFYDLSWQSREVMQPGQDTKDFVSGYAMSNKYEDFAESFIYYVLFNDDFVSKAKHSDILSNKYNFFKKHLFPNGEFLGTNFSTMGELQDYYWDITKLSYSSTNFLTYLNNLLYSY